MKRYLALFLVLLFTSSVQAVEIKPLKVQNPIDNEKTISVENRNSMPETPKALLNDEEYKLKGKIEYDAEGAVFLDEDAIKPKIMVNKSKKYQAKSILQDKSVLSEIQIQKQLNNPQIDEYTITPTFGEVSSTTGNITYGATFGADMDSAQLEYRTKFFTRYDNKYFGILTGFGKDQYTTSGIQRESLYISPELKLGHGLVLKNDLKINPSISRHSDDIILQFTPTINKKQSNMQFEAGLGQTYYHTTGSQSYNFSISTKFQL